MHVMLPLELSDDEDSTGMEQVDDILSKLRLHRLHAQCEVS